MATTTTNLALRRPETTDFVSVALDIASNMTTLDDKWATSAAADIGSAAAAGSALTVARTDHVHKVGSGTVGAPGLPIGEADSGFYRIGAGNIGAAIAGVKAWAYSAAGIFSETAIAVKHVASVAALSGYIKIFAKSDENLYKETGAGDEVRILDADIFTAQGDLVYGTGAETFTQLAKGTAHQGLKMNSGATAPEWGASLQSILTTTGDVVYASSANTPARLAVGNNGDGLILSGGLPVYAPDASHLSPIINANFNIWQDGTSFTSIADATWGPDNWIYGKVGAVVHDLLRSTDVPSVASNSPLSNYSLQLDVTTADSSIASGDYCTIATRIEGYNWLPFAQRAFVLGFWVKAAKTGTHCVYLKNSGSDRTFLAEYTVSVADTWEYKTVAVTASPSAGTWDYTAGRGLEIGWTLSCGSTFQSTVGWTTGDFKGTSSQVNETDNTANNFRIYGAHLTLGAYDKLFVTGPHALEFMRCERYNYVIAPGTAAHLIGMGQAYTSSDAIVYIKVPRMRASPAISVSSASHFSLSTFNFSLATAPTSITLYTYEASGSGAAALLVTGGGATLTAGNCTMLLSNTAGSAYIKVTSRIP